MLRKLCEENPDNARVHFLLGALLERLGRDEASLVVLQRALELDPCNVQAVSATVAVLARNNRVPEGQSLLVAALDRLPANAQLWSNLGAIREQASDYPGALDAYDEALALGNAPASARMNRGYVLTRLGRLQDALENNRIFAAQQPQNADARFNVAEVLLAMRRPAESLAECDATLLLAPMHASAKIARGLALASLERLDEARAEFDEVRARNPQAILDFSNAFDPRKSDDPERFDPELIFLSSSYERLHDCDWSQRDALIARFSEIVLQRLSSNKGIADPAVAYNALTLPLQDGLRLAIARGIAQRLEITAAAAQEARSSRSTSRKKLRIGYLSPDFREHLNAYLLRPLIALHDRSRFEVFCYSTGPADASAIRKRVEAAADRFVEAFSLDDDGIASLLRNDDIDILVDAGGYTTYARPGVSARRPAPVQVGYLAFPGSQGMDAVPWRIVDRTASPPEQRAAWSEALVYLPRTFFIYDKFEPLAAVRVSREDYALPENAFVYCSFNNYYKIEPRIFGAWMDILRAVPSSVLWLAGRNAQAVDNLRREASQRGIAEERLIFAPLEPRERYRARFRLADLFLDTPIFNAMTTACDALSAGLPLLTVPGSSFASRVAASLLAAADFPEGIVDSLDAYARRAIEWGRNPEALQRIRRAKLTDPLASALFDTEGRVREIEAAYEEIWRRHLSGLAPESFDVATHRIAAWRNRWH
ncbi:MAG TPA: tetratricopeptide repeat protein [Burkholderiales bacterium]|nr:tetratricopeptide repeat protein [Burkholderiales bacterium]